MKTQSVGLTVFAVLFLVNASAARGNELSLDRFRVFLMSGQCIEGNRATLTTDELVGVSMAGDYVTIPRIDMRTLDRYAGTKARTGATIGACLGLVSALTTYAVLEKADSDFDVDEAAFMPVFLGFTLGGGLVGMIFGSAFASWEQVYPPKPIGFGPEEAKTSVTFVFRF